MLKVVRNVISLSDIQDTSLKIFFRYLLTSGFMLLMLTGSSFSQGKTEYIPDGTQGEMLEVMDSTKLPSKWRDKRWRLFNGRFTTFKFGGGFLYEFAGYSQNEEGKRQMDSIGSVLEPAFAVRDFRLVASG
jgi:phosphate-selective porin OprO/OprP